MESSSSRDFNGWLEIDDGTNDVGDIYIRSDMSPRVFNGQKP